MINWIITLMMAYVAGRLYRTGGSGQYNTKVRDMGIPSVMVFVMWVWGGWHWSLFLSWAAMFGSLTTYWDFVNRWLPVQDKNKEYWWNWLLHGLTVSFSMICWVVAYSHNWDMFWIRNAVVALGTMLISVLTGKVEIEENGRGAISILTLPILFF